MWACESHVLESLKSCISCPQVQPGHFDPAQMDFVAFSPLALQTNRHIEAGRIPTSICLTNINRIARYVAVCAVDCSTCDGGPV